MIKEAICEITSQCNMSCEHCYGSFGEKKVEDVSTSDWFRIIRKLSNKGIRDFVILGGEPTLLKEKFYKILQFAIDNFKNVTVETNGTVPTDLDGYDCTVAVSLESHIAGKNNAIRHGKVTEANPKGLISISGKKKGHFEIAISKLRGLTTPKIIRYTLRQDTDIISSILLAERLGAKAIFVPLVAMGRGSELHHQVPNAKKLRESYDLLLRMNYRTKGKHIIQHPQYFIWNTFFWVPYVYKQVLNGEIILSPAKRHALSSDYDYLRRKRLHNKYLKIANELVDRGRICAAGIHRLFVDSQARVFPCPFLVYEPFYCGNILKDDINYIYDNLNKFNEWVSAVPPSGKCSTCKTYKICNGGGVCTWISNMRKEGINCPINLDIQKSIGGKKQ